MKKRFNFIPWLLSLVLLVGSGVQPVYAGAPVDEPCNGVDFYIYNAIDIEVYIDLSNWTTYDHYFMGHLQLGGEANFKAPAGVVELYVEAMGPNGFELDDWSYFENCSRVAYYIKLVNGQPALKIRATHP